MLLGNPYEDIEENEGDTHAKVAKRVTSITYIVIILLLVLNVCTIWIFKQKRIRYIHETGLSLLYGVVAGLIIKLVGVSISEVRSPRIGTCDKVTYNFSEETLPYYITTEFTNGSSKLKRLYAYSDTLMNNETALVVINKLSEALQFDPEIFFYILLPPIIFFAGYDLKKKHFFRNIGSILMFAFVGTTISAFAVAAIMWLYCQTGMEAGLKEEFIFFECLLFGALISATDPVTVLALFSELNVDVDLYALIFGESVMNDAVAIVLFESVLSYAPYRNASFSAVGFLSCVGQFCLTFFGSFFIGTVVGLITAMITKLTRLCDFPVLETSLFTLMSYSSFLLSEAAGFTGIVGILFCAITQAHYTSRNLSVESKQRVFELFETLNFLAENFVFSYIGLFLFTYDGHEWRPGFIVCSFLAIAVARLVNVFPLSGLLNLNLRQKIPCKFQLMMWWAGLRGAIAFALAAEYSEGVPRRIILTTTLVIVLATVLINGSTTTTVLELLRIRVGIVEDAETDHIINQLAQKQIGDEDLHRLQEQSGLGEMGWRFLKTDYSYLVPLFTIEGSTAEDAFPWCGPVARWLTSERRADRQESLGDDDVSILEEYIPVEDTEAIISHRRSKSEIPSSSKQHVTNNTRDQHVTNSIQNTVPNSYQNEELNME
ncbi:sodium/hydrogen exchanger 6-like isoform X2 [Bolinopsis microptera]|uniref:sodium/hydrogen exchanger 6-like isoform X2 n=1 Tax=Bolinopsis microptera TaxID=2820187 RepID=UPI0030797156